MYSVVEFASGLLLIRMISITEAPKTMDSENQNVPLAKIPSTRRLPILLRRAWFSLNQAFRRRCARLGLTPDQFTALRTLVEAGKSGLTQNELVAAMSSDPNTVTSLLHRMETNKWIERRPDENDRRARRVRVLPEGHRKYRTARREAAALQKEVLTALPTEVRNTFLQQLECVADACRERLGNPHNGHHRP